MPKMDVVQEIVEEMMERVSSLDKYIKEYKQQGNTSGETNARNRRDELLRLKRFIDERWTFQPMELRPYRDIMTPERVELLFEIQKLGVTNVNSLLTKTNMKRGAILISIQRFEEYGFVKKYHNWRFEITDSGKGFLGQMLTKSLP